MCHASDSRDTQQNVFLHICRYTRVRLHWCRRTRLGLSDAPRSTGTGRWLCWPSDAARRRHGPWAPPVEDPRPPSHGTARAGLRLAVGAPGIPWTCSPWMRMRQPVLCGRSPACVAWQAPPPLNPLPPPSSGLLSMGVGVGGPPPPQKIGLFRAFGRSKIFFGAN